MVSIRWIFKLPDCIETFFTVFIATFSHRPFEESEFLCVAAGKNLARSLSRSRKIGQPHLSVFARKNNAVCTRRKRRTHLRFHPFGGALFFTGLGGAFDIPVR